MKPERSAGAIVFIKEKEPKYLLLHYEAKHWDFPKGNIEAGESETDTAKREIEEETGIKDVDIIKGFKEKIQYYFKFKGELINKTVVFYLAKTQTEQIKLSFEHIGSIWLPYDKAIEKLTFKNAKEILEKANKFLKTHKTLDEF
ncbi:MAG: NUDIX domain-containing protein [Candidatus Woesearchaeota archaeon]|jgi:8-oxo-dGTP pyrophosphatase MutT (NUDIX family)|nr:NUDIX domain-containing protein [Candidatus Woesearchaeota archaeon]|tara:strand:+ start:789 stop:1220 length:432 start_codon:yes stop_codon:yes gene_type:complete